MFIISSSASKRKRGGPGGLNKVCAISPELQTVVGETAMSRTQVLSISSFTRSDFFPLINSNCSLLNSILHSDCEAVMGIYQAE